MRIPSCGEVARLLKTTKPPSSPTIVLPTKSETNKRASERAFQRPGLSIRPHGLADNLLYDAPSDRYSPSTSPIRPLHITLPHEHGEGAGMHWTGISDRGQCPSQFPIFSSPWVAAVAYAVPLLAVNAVASQFVKAEHCPSPRPRAFVGDGQNWRNVWTGGRCLSRHWGRDDNETPWPAWNGWESR